MPSTPLLIARAKFGAAHVIVRNNPGEKLLCGVREYKRLRKSVPNCGGSLNEG